MSDGPTPGSKGLGLHGLKGLHAIVKDLKGGRDFRDSKKWFKHV